MIRTVSTAMIALSIAACLTSERQTRPGQQAPRLDYEAHNISPLDALIHLGELYDQPLGIVSADQKIATDLVSAQAPKATSREALAALMQELPAYEWTESEGVLIVRPRAVPPLTKRMLGIVIQRISAQNVDIDALSFRLWMEIQLQVDPESRTKGFMGVGHSRDDFDLGPLDLTNVTVEGVLDEIVRKRKSAAWVVLPPPQTLKGTSRDRLWGIVTYSVPPQPLDQLCCLNLEYLK